MPIQHGDGGFYIDAACKIHNAKAGSNERNGKLIVVTGSHELHDVSAFDFFRTKRAAQLSVLQRQTRVKGR